MNRQQQDPASAEERETDEALRAIAEPRRRKILQLVAHDELAAGEIAAAFDITRTAVSQHLTVLKNAGLLSERRDGTRRLYRARAQGLADRGPGDVERGGARSCGWSPAASRRPPALHRLPVPVAVRSFSWP